MLAVVMAIECELNITLILNSLISSLYLVYLVWKSHQVSDTFAAIIATRRAQYRARHRLATNKQSQEQQQSFSAQQRRCPMLASTLLISTNAYHKKSWGVMNSLTIKTLKHWNSLYLTNDNNNTEASLNGIDTDTIDQSSEYDFCEDQSRQMQFDEMLIYQKCFCISIFAITHIDFAFIFEVIFFMLNFIVLITQTT